MLSPSGKSLGADGLPTEVYKKYAETLVPQLKQTLLDALELGCLPPSMSEATIILYLSKAALTQTPIDQFHC